MNFSLNFEKIIKYPLNSILSFLIRFLIILIFVDLLNFNFETIFFISYIYLIIQSYFIQKKYIFKFDENRLSIFIIVNLILGLLEYFILELLRLKFIIYYSVLVILTTAILFFLRFYIYNFKIFK
jgi:hypothetical protein